MESFFSVCDRNMAMELSSLETAFRQEGFDLAEEQHANPRSRRLVDPGTGVVAELWSIGGEVECALLQVGAAYDELEPSFSNTALQRSYRRVRTDGPLAVFLRPAVGPHGREVAVTLSLGESSGGLALSRRIEPMSEVIAELQERLAGGAPRENIQPQLYALRLAPSPD